MSFDVRFSGLQPTVSIRKGPSRLPLGCQESELEVCLHGSTADTGQSTADSGECSHNAVTMMRAPVPEIEQFEMGALD